MEKGQGVNPDAKSVQGDALFPRGGGFQTAVAGQQKSGFC
jgi:hypothetical protein